MHSGTGKQIHPWATLGHSRIPLFSGSFLRIAILLKEGAFRGRPYFEPVIKEVVIQRIRNCIDIIIIRFGPPTAATAPVLIKSFPLTERSISNELTVPSPDIVHFKKSQRMIIRFIVQVTSKVKQLYRQYGPSKALRKHPFQPPVLLAAQ